MKKLQMFEYNGYVFMEKMVIPHSEAMYQVIIPLWLDEKVKNTFSDNMILSEINLELSNYIKKPAKESIDLAVKKLKESDISLDEQSDVMRRNEILDAIHKDIIFNIGFPLFFNIITESVINMQSPLISITREENDEYEVLITLYLESNFSSYIAQVSKDSPITGKSIIQFEYEDTKYIANYISIDAGESCCTVSNRWMRSSQIIVADDLLLDRLIKMANECEFEPLQNFCKSISLSEREMLLKDNPHLTNYLLKKDIPIFFSVSVEMTNVLSVGVSFIFTSIPSMIGNTEISLLTPNEIYMRPTEDWIDMETMNVGEHDKLFTPYELMGAFYSEDKCLYSFLVGTLQTLIKTEPRTGIRNMRVFGINASINETPMTNQYSNISVYVTLYGNKDKDGIAFAFPNPSTYKSHHAIIEDINNCYAYIPVSFIPDNLRKNLNSVEVVKYLKDALYDRIPDEYQINWEDSDIIFLGYRYNYAIFCMGLDYRRNIVTDEKSYHEDKYDKDDNENSVSEEGIRDLINSIFGNKNELPWRLYGEGDENI